MNTFIFVDKVGLIMELMNATEERGGMLLYTKAGNSMVINDMIEIPNASVTQEDTYLRIIADNKREELLKRSMTENLEVGEFHNHPSGSFEMSKQDEKQLKANKKVYKNFLLIIISRNGIGLYK